VLLEGEALLNDASSFTLFQIFLHLVEQLNEPGEHHQESGWAVFWEIVKSALKLAGGVWTLHLPLHLSCRQGAIAQTVTLDIYVANLF